MAGEQTRRPSRYGLAVSFLDRPLFRLMSYNSRATAEQRYHSARWNRRRRRMERTEENAAGVIVAVGEPTARGVNRKPPVIERWDDGAPLALLCSDGSRRHPGKSGKEGAYIESCRQVKIAVVPVVLPNEPRPRKTTTLEEAAKEAAWREMVTRRRVEAIMGGMTEDMTDWIGYDAAAKRHGRATVDACEKTTSAKVGAR
jgi:hypothetical protein